MSYVSIAPMYSPQLMRFGATRTDSPRSLGVLDEMENMMAALTESVNLIEQQEWLDPASDSVQKVVSGALNSPGGKPVDNMLNGVWLGHPLHPALIAVPLGAWTTTLVLDGLESVSGPQFAAGADASLVVGLLGALSSAATGLAQWQYTIGGTRRLGMMHALLNTGATVLYGSSLALRAGGKRRAGKLTALLGYGIVMASAYLGGEISYKDRVGMDHSTEEQPSHEFVAALPESEVAEGTMKQVDVSGVPMLIARQDGKIYALDSVCSHMGGPLAEGEMGDCSVTCPWHGSRFSLLDGSVIDGPATFPQPHYETRIRDGQIEVRQV